MNNIQTGGGRDNSGGDDGLILQLVIALSLGESTLSFLSIHHKTVRGAILVVFEKILHSVFVFPDLQ